MTSSREWNRTQRVYSKERVQGLVKRQSALQSMGAADSEQRGTLGGWGDSVLTGRVSRG